MKTLTLISLLALLLVASGLAQTPTPVDQVSLPTYIMGGAAYNQFTGANGLVSAIVPEVNRVGVYGSLSADLVPLKFTDPTTGKAGYLLSGSFRFGQHKVVHADSWNVLLIGGDFGPSFTQPAGLAQAGLAQADPGVAQADPGAAVEGTPAVKVGLAGSFTVTYVRQLTAHLAVGFPLRMLWVSGVGRTGQGVWNLVPEVGLIWKP
jgi:hypothetical protein